MRAITSRGPGCVVEPGERVAEGHQVVAVALRHAPTERLDLRPEVAEVAHLVHPGVRLHLVAVDDHGDLAQPAVRRRLQRLPELPLLQLAVPGQDEDPPLTAEHPVGEHESARLRDAHPERAGARDDLRCDRDVGVPGQPAEASQLVDALEVDLSERGEHRIEAGRVVAFRREVAVTGPKYLEVEPGDDVEGAEGGSRMTRTGALDHVQRIQAARVREPGGAFHGSGVEGAQPLELRQRDVAQGHAGSPVRTDGSSAAPPATSCSARSRSAG